MPLKIKKLARYEKLTPEHEKKITDFLETVKKEYDPLPFQYQHFRSLVPQDEEAEKDTTKNPLRASAYGYLMARQWHMDKALAMFKESMAYRKSNHLDEINSFPGAFCIRGFDQDDIQKEIHLSPPRRPARIDQVVKMVDENFSAAFHKWDKEGVPVLYLMIGTTNEKGLLDGLKANARVGQKPADVMWEYMMHILSLGEGLADYQNKRIAEKKIEGIDTSGGIIRSCTIVCDMKGFTYKMMWKPAVDLFMEMIKSLFRYYPDCVSRILCVNCPGMILFAYNIVKVALDPNVQKKITFCKPHETEEGLAFLIDKENIPNFYKGGECACPNNCIGSYDAKDPNVKTETSAANYEEEVPVKTETAKINGGQNFMKKFPVTNGDEISWDYGVDKESKLSFLLAFIPDTEDASTMKLEKMTEKDLKKYKVLEINEHANSNIHTADGKGVMVLLWTNTSQMKSKKLQLRVYKRDVSLEEVARHNAAEERNERTKEKHEDEKKSEDDVSVSDRE